MVASILPMTMESVVVAKRGTRIIGPISHQLATGGITIVVGPNGSGKTTFLRSMHGLERISSGKLAWSVPFESAIGKQAFVFQSPIIMRRSVRENLTYPLSLVGTPKVEAARAAEAWAAKIGLATQLDQNATRLSGGEKQKLALARALIRNPDILFLDEPCANLDGKATRAIEGILKEAKANGTRLVMSTHDLGQAQRLADDVIFMLGGMIHDQGSAPDFFEHQNTIETTQFMNGDIVE